LIQPILPFFQFLLRYIAKGQGDGQACAPQQAACAPQQAACGPDEQGAVGKVVGSLVELSLCVGCVVELEVGKLVARTPKQHKKLLELNNKGVGLVTASTSQGLVTRATPQFQTPTHTYTHTHTCKGGEGVVGECALLL